MNPNPLDASTLPDLLRAQIKIAHPTGTFSRVAEHIGVNPTTLYAWVAHPSASNYRKPDPTTIREVLAALNASPEVVERALRLWAAAKGAA